MKWVYDDGGRSKYFKTEHVGDCVTRAIAIATGKDYKEVYDEIQRRSKSETSKQLTKHRGGKRSSARNGVFKETWKEYLDDLGWVKHSTMGYRTGVQCHLTADELPKGTLIVQVSKHLVCVKDGVIHDTYNSSEKEYYDEFGNIQVNSNRAVYGYWTLPESVKPEKSKLMGYYVHIKRQEAETWFFDKSLDSIYKKISNLKNIEEVTMKYEEFKGWEFLNK